MAYFNEIRELIRDNSKNNFEILIKKKYFSVEGGFEVVLYQNDLLILKLKDEKLIFNGSDFKIVKSTKFEIVVSGYISNYSIEKNEN